MGIRYGLRQVEASTADQLIQRPELYEPYQEECVPQYPVHSRWSFFPWIFRMRLGREVSTTSDPRGFQVTFDYCDLDKAWHGIHYLLTNSEGETDHPLGFLLSGGTPMPVEEEDQTPSRVFSSPQVKEIKTQLSAVTDEFFRSSYDPDTMMKLQIYPEVWDRGHSELSYLLHHFSNLKRFIETSAEKGYGMIGEMG